MRERESSLTALSLPLFCPCPYPPAPPSVAATAALPPIVPPPLPHSTPSNELPWLRQRRQQPQWPPQQQPLPQPQPQQPPHQQPSTWRRHWWRRGRAAGARRGRCRRGWRARRRARWRWRAQGWACWMCAACHGRGTRCGAWQRRCGRRRARGCRCCPRATWWHWCGRWWVRGRWRRTLLPCCMTRWRGWTQAHRPTGQRLRCLASRWACGTCHRRRWQACPRR